LGLQERSRVAEVIKWDRKIKSVSKVRNKRVSGSPAMMEAEGKEVRDYLESMKEGRRVVSIRISDKYIRFVEVSLIVKLFGLKSSIIRGPRVKKKIRP
jgi:hypothetical protein